MMIYKSLYKLMNKSLQIIRSITIKIHEIRTHADTGGMGEGVKNGQKFAYVL